MPVGGLIDLAQSMCKSSLFTFLGSPDPEDEDISIHKNIRT